MDNQQKFLLIEVQHFLENMHIMDADWTVKESTYLHGKVSAALAAAPQAQEPAYAPECEELLEWMEEAVNYVNEACRSPSLEAEGRKLLRLAGKN